MADALYNLKWDTNRTTPKTWTMRSGTPANPGPVIDLTGCHVRMMWKDPPPTGSLIPGTTRLDASDGNALFAPLDNTGKITFQPTLLAIQAVPAGRYVFDLVITYANGKQAPPFGGEVLMRQGVTQ